MTTQFAFIARVNAFLAAKGGARVTRNEAWILKAAFENNISAKRAAFSVEDNRLAKADRISA